MHARILDEHDARDVQRPVLRDPGRDRVRHLAVTFPEGSHPEAWLYKVLYDVPSKQDADSRPACRIAVVDTPDDRQRPRGLLLNIGFTFRGLQRLNVPWYVLAVMRQRSPAFASGAALRAAPCCGDVGAGDAAHWVDVFRHDQVHAVISLNADEPAALDAETRRIEDIVESAVASATTPALDSAKVKIHALPDGGKLKGEDGRGRVHFDFVDGESSVRIKAGKARPADASDETSASASASASRPHAIGEFLLGYEQDSGANPWIALPVRQVLPPQMRQFFHNASFGVLRQMEQDVPRFEAFVDKCAGMVPGHLVPEGYTARDYIKAKLCGRWPDGQRATTQPPPTPSEADSDEFDYHADRQGRGCPFGAHMRRENPRGTPIAQRESRPLMRRGMPYGPRYELPVAGQHDSTEAKQAREAERGLLGWFFCSSIEDQFEHVLGQWAQRVPLGSPDRGNAKDPLIGWHEDPDAVFEIPLESGPPLRLTGFTPFVRTRGTAYLFYPGLHAVLGILDNRLWVDPKEIDA